MSTFRTAGGINFAVLTLAFEQGRTKGHHKIKHRNKVPRTEPKALHERPERCLDYPETMAQWQWTCKIKSQKRESLVPLLHFFFFKESKLVYHFFSVICPFTPFSEWANREWKVHPTGQIAIILLRFRKVSITRQLRKCHWNSERSIANPWVRLRSHKTTEAPSAL